MRLSWLENGYARPFFLRAILTNKVDQTDPAFGMQLGFISWSVRAKLQVSVSSGYDFIPLWLTSRLTPKQAAFWSTLWKTQSAELKWWNLNERFWGRGKFDPIYLSQKGSAAMKLYSRHDSTVPVRYCTRLASWSAEQDECSNNF